MAKLSCEELCEIFTKKAKDLIRESPLRPEMWTGTFKDNRDCNILLLLITEEINNLCLLTGKDEYSFILKWGVGPHKYFRNINYELTAKENLKTIKAFSDDFLEWIEK